MNQVDIIIGLLHEFKSLQIAAGLVIGFGILAFILSWIGKLLKDVREALPANDGDKEKPKKKPDEGGDEEADIERLRMEFIAAQAEFIDDQRALIKMIVHSTIKVKSVDDTIPMRDDLLDKLTNESNELGE